MAITKCLIDDRCRKEYIFPTLLNWVEKGDILPQKYLYSNHIGAFRYSELTRSGIHQKVYNSFPINFSGSELNQFFKENVEKLVGAQLRKTQRLGFFILGAGLGNRESEMVRWLIYNFPEIKNIRIWLLDISEEMMTKSIEAFKRIDDDRLDVRGFILDFEESLSEIATVRSELTEDVPCLFLLFGNTIANLDQKVFLDTISHYMFPGDVFIMEYLLADEKTYKESFDDQTEQSGRFGSPVVPYDPREDNRFEFVVSPLRTLGIAIQPKSLKLYRKCIPGKGISFCYVYELNMGDIETLKSMGMGKALYAGWELPLLKIERLLSNYVSTVSRSSFKEPTMCKIDYGINTDFTFIYSMMQKEGTPELLEQLSREETSPIIHTLSFEEENYRVIVNQTAMECTPKQYFLIMAAACFPIEKAGPSSGPDKIYDKFLELIEQWAERSSNIDYRTEMVLDNLTKLPPSEHAGFVSKGFRDIENKVKRGEASIFQLLLPLLPHRNQWFLNLSESCVQLPG